MISSSTPGERLASFRGRCGWATLCSFRAPRLPIRGRHPAPRRCSSPNKLRIAQDRGGAGRGWVSMADVVRTRIFVSHIEDSEAVARAHSEVFAETRPATRCCEVSRSAQRCWSRSRSTPSSRPTPWAFSLFSVTSAHVITWYWPGFVHATMTRRRLGRFTGSPGRGQIMNKNPSRPEHCKS